MSRIAWSLVAVLFLRSMTSLLPVSTSEVVVLSSEQVSETDSPNLTLNTGVLAGETVEMTIFRPPWISLPKSRMTEALSLPLLTSWHIPEAKMSDWPVFGLSRSWASRTEVALLVQKTCFGVM